MTQVLRTYQVHVDALPALCAKRTCLRDRVKGSAYCDKHKKIKHSLDGKHRKVVNISNVCNVYFISLGDKIKIGQSKNIKRRFNALQMSCPEKLTLEANIEAYAQLEYALHELFKDDRLHGEWFKRTPRLEQIIEFAKINDLKSIEMEARSIMPKASSL